MGRRRYKVFSIFMAAAALACAGCGPAPEPSAAPTPPPTATISPDELNRGLGQVVISEFMEKNRAVIQDEDGDFSDWIEIYNQSGEAVDTVSYTHLRAHET